VELIGEFVRILGELARIVTEPRLLIAAFGTFAYVGLFAVIFAETGLFVGFFLPGDSLLFVAGVLASLEQQGLQLPVVVVVCVAAAILGNLAGFAFGRRVGRPLFDRPDSRLFRRKHLLATEAFYERHGGKTIVLARFLPFVRTFAPIVAGIGNMPYRRFVTYTIVGGVLWGTALPVAGYLFGRALGDNIDRFLLPVILLIVGLSVLPAAVQLVRSNRGRMAARLGPRPGGTVQPPIVPEPEREP
jgi:membrane-associated protein